MSEMQSKSKNADLYQQACEIMPGGVNHELRYKKPYPLYIRESKGCRKWDVEGVEYVDFKMGSASQYLGYCPDVVLQAMSEQMHKSMFTSDCSELEIEWAQILCDLYPSAEQVRFTASGTESTMLAIRMARAYTKRPKILRINGHFHGWHDHLLKGAKPGLEGASSLGIPKDIQDLIVVAPANLEVVADYLKDPEIGTVILEGSGANYGSVPLPDGLLQGVRQLTEENDQVFILDEIITGFRWSPGGLQARDGVVPDLTTLAKVLTGGLPGGAVVGKKKLMRYLDPGETIDGMSPPISHKGTFNASPLIAAGAVAALKQIRTGKPQEKADAAATHLKEGILGLFDQMDIAGAVYGEASTFHIYFGECEARSVKGLSPNVIRGVSKELVSALNLGLQNCGVNLMSYTSGVTSSAHEISDIDEALNAFETTLTSMKKNGVLS